MEFASESEHDKFALEHNYNSGNAIVSGYRERGSKIDRAIEKERQSERKRRMKERKKGKKSARPIRERVQLMPTPAATLKPR